MKTILGLDIGSNSIGWALIKHDLDNKEGEIVAIGSRIIPLSTDKLKDFQQGRSVSQAAERRMARQARRLKHRYKLRRERLIKVFKILGWFPSDFPEKFEEENHFNINEFVPFSENTIEEAKRVFKVDKLPNDWAIYYLRDKALKEQISIQELARVIYHFNQRRGFKSSRIENKNPDAIQEETFPKKETFYEFLKIVEIKDTGERVRNNLVFEIKGQTKDGEIYSGIITRKYKPEWLNQEIELEITKIIKKDGSVSYTFREPDRSNWEKRKLALEKDIKLSGLYVGQYHFQKLLEDRNYRIKDQVVDRKFYMEEFEAIWKKQAEFYPELKNCDKIDLIAQTLYQHNKQKQKELKKLSLLEIIKDDIIYYQRPLKSQKRLIGECRFEKKNYTDKYGRQPGYKVAPKSSPIFQEYRIWQTINNLRIFKNEEQQPDGKIKFDVEKTNEILTIQNKEKLFELFDSKNEVSFKDILKALKLSSSDFRINFPETRDLKGNETKAAFRSIFKRHNYLEKGESILNDKESFFNLWHLTYSVTDEGQLIKSLINKFGFDENLAIHIAKMPPFKKEYAAYSTKALKKLVALMRCGKYWNENEIDTQTKERILNIINGNLKDSFPIEIQNKLYSGSFSSISDFQGLPVYLACYVVYGRHSERELYEKYDNPDEIDHLKLIPTNSLRNPVVEKVIRETLLVVKDIWKQYGRPDEIHIEMARELKRNAKEREAISKQILENEKERKRIAEILKYIKGANPNSPLDIERLRLWEELGKREAKENFPKLSLTPTKAEIEKYLLWGEQNHISPYTGKVIPLSELFSEKYEIEHIIPKSRFFDNSLTNKTICETEVNRFKDNLTALELIQQYGGTTIPTTNIKILTLDEYKQHIKSTFRGRKLANFLREEIPDDFINRQINETRYITRKLGELLYPIAKESIVFTIGSITSELKDKWGLNRVWKEILKPRFERLEKITGEKLIDYDTSKNYIHFAKDYKRIDHRHHALDALVIAATTREHIRYLNSLNAVDTVEELQNVRLKLVKRGVREFHLPWKTFTQDTKDKLQEIIVSFKNKIRVVQRGRNKYWKWVEQNGKWVKKLVLQDNSELFTIRKSLFKEPSGIINIAEYKDVNVNEAIRYQFNYLTNKQSNLQERIADKKLRAQINELIKNCSFDLNQTLEHISKYPIKDENGNTLKQIKILYFKEYSAKRVTLDTSFTEDKINKIPYSNHSNNKLVNLLKEHLREFNNNPKDAFTGEGLELLYKKYGKPIRKITIIEEVGKKIPIKGKYFEVDKGTNLFFVIYQNVNDPFDRIISQDSSISIVDAVQTFINGGKIQDLGENKPGYKKVILSPNDLVYVPEPGETPQLIDWSNKKKISNRVYKVVSFSKNQIFFIPHFVSEPIIQRIELGSNNKAEKAWDGTMIKNVCIKLNIDRLGNFSPEL